MDPESVRNAGFNATSLDQLPANATVREILSHIYITNTLQNVPIEDRFPTYNVLSSFMGVISAALVVIRIMFKVMAHGYGPSWGLDDLLLASIIVVGSLNTLNNSHGVGATGLGKHVWTLADDPDNINDFLSYFLALTVVYFCLVMLLKMAFLAFFLRIFPSQRARRLLRSTMVIVILYGLAFVLAGGLQCQPIDFYWTGWDGEHKGYCVDRDWIAWTNAAFSILLDFWIIIIPLHEINGTTLEPWKKFTGGLMLSLGLIMTFVSSIRIWYLVRFTQDDLDPTWNFVDVCVWSTVEINVGIWCLCIPSLRVMILFFRMKYTQRLARRSPSGQPADVKHGRPGRFDEMGANGIQLQDLSDRPPRYTERDGSDDTLVASPPQVGEATRA